jgi:hypothetical protein
VTLCRQVDDEWKVLSLKKGDVPLAQCMINKQTALGDLLKEFFRYSRLAISRTGGRGRPPLPTPPTNSIACSPSMCWAVTVPNVRAVCKK